MQEFHTWHNEKFGDYIKNSTDVVKPNAKKKVALKTIAMGTTCIVVAGSVVAIGMVNTETTITALSGAAIVFIAVCIGAYKYMTRKQKHTLHLYNRG